MRARQIKRLLLRPTLAAALALLGVDALSTGAAQAAPPTGFSDTVVSTVTLPVGLGFTPDGRMLVTTKPGQLYAYSPSGTKTLALDASGFICAGQPGQDERGMLGVAADPSFTSNGYIYVYYSHSTSGSCFNRVSRFTLDSTNHVVSGSEKVLIDGIQGDGFHNGGDLLFGKDGDLYVSVGDGHCLEGCDPSNQAAQDLKNLNGKILRIAPDGSVPAGNAFSGTGTARCNASPISSGKCQEIYAYGFRNPFRIALDPNAAGTRIFVDDVGENTTEEVDQLKVGGNFGWPMCEGSCSTSGLTNPYFTYADNTGGGRAAIAGGAFVPNGAWNSAYNGRYLFSDYVKNNTYQITATGTSGSGMSTFSAGATAISMQFAPQDLTKTGGQQALYYTDLIGGTVHRVTSGTTTPNASFTTNAPTGPAAYCSTPGTTAGAAPFAVNFDGSASHDPNGLTLTYAWDFGDGTTATTTTPTTTHTYTKVGSFTPKLVVTNSSGGASTAATGAVRTDDVPPALAVTSPAPADTFTVGQTYTPSGTATDSTGAALPASALTWQVWLFHINHVHPVLDPVAGSGATAFVAPPAENLSAVNGNSRLLICLSGTDGKGVTRTIEQDFDPTLVHISLASQPSGLKIGLAEDDVDPSGTMTTPATFTSWAGYQLHLTAANQTDSTGTAQAFSSWSDGGAQTHAVTPTADTTYTAAFTPTTVTCTAAQLLANPGFESSGTGWTQSSTLGFNPITTSTTAEPAHSGTHIASFDGNGSKDTDTIAQSVAIPSGCSAQLSYWLHVDTTENTTTAKPDTFTVQVLNSSGTVLGTLGTYSNLNKASGYTQHTADLSAYAGQTVTLKFIGTETDANGGTTNFVLDDTAVNTSGTTPVTNDFSLAASPASGSVTLGNTVTTTVTTAVTAGSAESVALSATGGPAGSTVTFSPTPVTSGGSSTLSVATTSGTTPGTYTITITGTAASGTHTATYTVTVASGSACTPGQLLTNPGFESGDTGWTTSSTLGLDPITNDSSQAAHSGTYKAWFDGNGKADTDTLAQTVTIPAGCSASLSYWQHIDTTESTTTAKPDTFKVQVLNSAGTVLATLATYSNLDKNTGYAQKTFSLSAYAGQTVTIKWTGAETDANGGTTDFIIDDTAVQTS